MPRRGRRRLLANQLSIFLRAFQASLLTLSSGIKKKTSHLGMCVLRLHFGDVVEGWSRRASRGPHNSTSGAELCPLTDCSSLPRDLGISRVQVDWRTFAGVSKILLLAAPSVLLARLKMKIFPAGRGRRLRPENQGRVRITKNVGAPSVDHHGAALQPARRERSKNERSMHTLKGRGQ